MNIKKIEKTVNGNKLTQYEFGGVVYDNIQTLLKKNFRTQGVFYERVFNVSEEDAEIAGWGPHDTAFCDTAFSGSFGWKIFLKQKGIIAKQIETETVSISEILFGV